MCTVVVLHRPGHAWPLLLAANRDEMIGRAWDPPGSYWPDRPGVVAGRDRTGNGTWLGLNAHGVVAAVLNRAGSLGPIPGKLSRGELPLLALEHPTAEAAVRALTILDAGAWRSFNMVVADAAGAYFLRGLGTGSPHQERLADGLHIVTAKDPDDTASPRVARHLSRLRACEPPEPPDRWAGWQAILSDRSGPIESQINVAPHGGFATVSSSLIGLPHVGKPTWLFAAGPPDTEPYKSISEI